VLPREEEDRYQYGVRHTSLLYFVPANNTTVGNGAGGKQETALRGGTKEVVGSGLEVLH
jgi:hypothetical protein